MDIPLFVLFLGLALLCSWLEQTKIRRPFLRYLVNGAVLFFLFVAAKKIFPGFLQDKSDELSMGDLTIMAGCIMMWTLAKYLFPKKNVQQ